jgi:ABC-type sugar transport system ATPase subunit
LALLRVEGVAKSYPGARALAGVDLSVDPGEVHALLGENGAGKSTLMKAIAGYVTPDAGHMELDGERVPFGSPEAARTRGIGIVYQELSLVPQLSIAENVLLGRWPTNGRLVDWRTLRTEAGRHLERVGLELDPELPVRGLGMAERQLVEIAKALSSEVRLLLLDEPTSALSDREAERLFELIGELKDSEVAIIYVSHRLSEVLDIADRITVLRDGEKVDTLPAEGVSEEQLAQMMVGHELSGGLAEHPSQRSREGAGVVLRARDLARPPRLRPVNLELRQGEVVTVFGLVGAGRTRLARTLFGLEPAVEGSLELFGEERRVGSPADAIAAGIGFVGEDRTAGLVPRMSVANNITLASLEDVARGPVLDFAREKQVAERYVGDLAIRTSSLDQLVETLSGGNQQKVVLARWMCSRARVLILDDPTRGIDVGAKEEVFGLVRRLADDGIALLYLTSEIREARELGDRLLVMSGGRIVTEFEAGASEEEIMTAAGGAHD